MKKWSIVIISGEYPLNISASGLMNQIDKKYRDAGLPDDVEVYSGKTTSGDHIFVFSPKVLEIAGDVLSSFSASPYQGEPSLSALHRVNL